MPHTATPALQRPARWLRRWAAAASLAIAVIAPQGGVWAQNTALKVDRVAVFKNATGFFQYQGSVAVKGGSVVVEDLPDALFGSWWLTCPDGKIAAVSSYQQDVQVPAKQISDAAFYKLNIGKTVTITTENGTVATGTVREVNGNNLILQAADGWHYVALGEVRHATFADKPNTELAETQTRPVLEIRFDNPKTQHTLRMVNLQRNIGWLPQYQLVIKDNKQAALTLRASLVNDAYELNKSTVNFVVGNANFQFQHLQEPLLSQQGIQQLFNQLVGGGGGGYFQAQTAFANVALAPSANEMYDRYGGDNGPLADGVEGEGVEDLFFYTVKDVTLPKGGRGVYDIFNIKLIYKDLYDVQLRPNNVYQPLPLATSADQPGFRNSVWHAIRLENIGELPWTTGSVMTFREKGADLQPVGQDQLYYTPSKGSSVIKMTTAPDVIVEDSEKEVSREVNIKLKNGVYDLVTVEGLVLIRNYKTEAITIEIARQITGETKASNTDWKVDTQVSFASGVNKMNNVRWSLEVPSGDEKKIAYKYQYYVKRD